MTPADPGDLVRVRTANNPAEAYLMQQWLESAGIRCQVVGDYLDAGIGDVPGLRPEVWVRQDQLQAAEEILAEAGRPTPNEPED
jgi:hypothetical protein